MNGLVKGEGENERISDFERFAQQNLTPVPFFRGVGCVLDCGSE